MYEIHTSCRFLEACEQSLEENEEEPALPRDLKHIPYQYVRLSEKELLARALKFYQLAAARRTLRYFSADPIPKEIIREIIRAAGILFVDSVKSENTSISNYYFYHFCNSTKVNWKMLSI